MHFQLTTWDIVLIIMVSLQAAAIAYSYSPRWKALIYSLPIPFTFTMLAVGRPVDATNVLGLIVLLIFTHGVRILHYKLRVPIIFSIAVAVLGYCALGWGTARIISGNASAFWISAGATAAIAIAMHKLSRDHKESGYRSPCPLWIKLPVIVLVVIGLMMIKRSLAGFTTVFPMAGIIAAYESRSCLWTICNQIPIMMLSLLPAMILIRALQPHWGLPIALALGWVAFLSILAALSRRPTSPIHNS